MTVTLLHPSRSRPEKSIQTIYNWIVKSGMVNVQLIVSVDTSDERISYYTSETYDKKLHQHGIEYSVIVNDNNSVVEATNRAAKEAKGDIFIYLSDDFKCPDNWGQLILDEFKKYTGPTLIKVDDCLQPFQTKVLTIPIMNRELYEKLGYFWHPGYKSMFVDEDLYWTAEKLGALKFAPHLKFPHIHPANPNPSMRCENDETYRRSADNWDQGKALFAKRKAAGFPL